MKTIRNLFLLALLGTILVALCLGLPTRGDMPAGSAYPSNVPTSRADVSIAGTRCPDLASLNKALRAAAALSIAPSEPILLSGGDSYGGGFKFAHKFKSGVLVIDGLGSAVIRGGADGILFFQAGNVLVKNLRVTGQSQNGIRVSGEYQRFENVTVDHAKRQGWLITISHFVAVNCAGLNTAEQHGAYIQQGADDVLLDHFTASGNGTCGIQVNVGGTVTLTDCTITGNAAWTNKGAAVNVLNCRKFTATNCTVRDNLWMGLSCSANENNPSSVTMTGGEVTFQPGQGGKCFNAGGNLTLTLAGVKVRPGVVKSAKAPSTYWYDITGGAHVTGQDTCDVKPAPAAVVAAGGAR